MREPIVKSFGTILINKVSKGIRWLPMNWCTSLNMIHMSTPSVDYNLWLKRWYTELNEPTKENLTRVSEFLSQWNSYNKTLVTSVINSTILPPTLVVNSSLSPTPLWTSILQANCISDTTAATFMSPWEQNETQWKVVFLGKYKMSS